MMYYIVLWSVIMYFFFSCQRRNDKKVVNDIYYLLNRLRSLWKISQPQSLKFIFILYDVFFPAELRHDRRQVVYGRPGFLLPVGVHLKATLRSMRPDHRIHLLRWFPWRHSSNQFSCQQINSIIQMLAAIKVNFFFIELKNCFKSQMLFCWQTSNVQYL